MVPYKPLPAMVTDGLYCALISQFNYGGSVESCIL